MNSILDMGLADKFAEFDIWQESDKDEKFEGVGSDAFMAVYSHEHVTIFPIHDIESLGNVFLYIYLGILPWQHESPQFETLKKRYRSRFAFNIKKNTKCVVGESYFDTVEVIKIIHPFLRIWLMIKPKY